MIKTWGVMAGLIVTLGIGLCAGYAIGHRAPARAAYAQGWSDAHCGVGTECEGGQQ